MAYVLEARVKDQTLTTGTGPLSLAGNTLAGYRPFNTVCGVGDTAPYAVEDSAGNWECGVATYTALNTIERTTIDASSNGGAAVNLAAGTKNIWLGALPRDMNSAVLQDMDAYSLVGRGDSAGDAVALPISAQALSLLGSTVPRALQIDTLAALKALTLSDAAAGTTIAALGSRFDVLSGTAASNGYTADNVVVVQNDAATATFVRSDYIEKNVLELDWWNAPLTGLGSCATQLDAMLDVAETLATLQKPVTCFIRKAHDIDAVSLVPNYTTVHGAKTGSLKVLSGLSLTSQVFRERSTVTGTTRNAKRIRVVDLTIDGIGRSYPVWLSNPDTGAAITDPQNDYSSPGVLDAGLYPGGIADVVTAKRRNGAAATTTGYIMLFSGVEDLEISGCTFKNHFSVTLATAGCLRPWVWGNRFENCGRVDAPSNAILIADYGSAWTVGTVSKANPAVVTVIGDPSATITTGTSFTLKNVTTQWGSQLPDGTYTAGTVSGSTVEISGVNSSGFTSTYQFDGLGLLTTASFIESKDALVFNNEFVDIKRAAIQASGNNTIVRNNLVRKSRESGIYGIRMLGGSITGNVVDEVWISDLVANAIEINYCVGTTIRDNRLMRPDGNGIAVVGGYKLTIDNNYIYRSGHRGAVLRPYGIFSERYSFGSPPAVAGIALPVDERCPIRVGSFSLMPMTGLISRNYVDDNRTTPVTDYAITCFKSGGAANNTVKELSILDNDFTHHPTAAVASLIDYGTDVVDAQTTIVRGNKKHTSASGMTKVLTYAAGAATGDQTITDIGFPPSKVTVRAIEVSAAFPVRQSFGMAHKTHAAQTASAFNALCDAWTGAAASATEATSTVARLNDSAGVNNFSATFVSWLPNGFKINLGTTTVGAKLHIECDP